MNLKRICATLPFSFLVLLVSISSCCAYSEGANLVVVASRISYGLGATIRISGMLALGGNAVADGLVAVQIKDRSGNLEFVRVVSTGTVPAPWKVRVVEFKAVDSRGNPASTFNRGSFANFKVSVKSLDTVLTRQVTLTLNLFDSVGFSIAILSSTFSLYPGELYNITTSMPIPSDAYVGPSVCCLSVLTEEKYPYCAEESVTFTITGPQTGPVSSALSAEGSAGSYSLSFKLPNNALLGDHYVHAGARYGPVGVSASTIFDYFWLYTDGNRDGTVNIVDVSIIAKAFGSKAGDLRFRQFADINGDYKVNIIDISAVAKDLGKKMMIA